MNKKIPRAFLVLCLGAPVISQAVPITYEFDRAIGVSGGVVGTVTTSGATGILASSDILSWAITVTTDTGTTATISAPVPSIPSLTEVNGTAFTATIDGLFFDFSSTDGSSVLLFGSLIDQDYLWQFASAGFGASSTGFERVACEPFFLLCPGALVFDDAINLGLTGNQQIATAVTQISEPNGLALLGLAIAGLALARRARIDSGRETKL